MVRVRVNMKGSGTQLDPFDHGFPHAIVLDANYVTHQMIVEVPNTLIPQSLRQAGIIRTVIPPFGNVVTGIDLSDHPKLYAFLDARYPDWAGLLQPDIA